MLSTPPWMGPAIQAPVEGDACVALYYIMIRATPYAYPDTEALLGVTLELIERPKGRLQPDKIYPPEPGRG